jgi:hypothetical protein
MVKNGFGIDFIEKEKISLVLEYWSSIDNQDTIEKSAEWFINEEADIDRKVTEVKSYDGKTLTPRSVEFNRNQERKKRFRQ